MDSLSPSPFSIPLPPSPEDEEKEIPTQLSSSTTIISSTEPLSLSPLSLTQKSSHLTPLCSPPSSTPHSLVTSSQCSHHSISLHLQTAPTHAILYYPCCATSVHIHANGFVCLVSSEPLTPVDDVLLFAFLGGLTLTTGDVLLFFVKSHTLIVEDIYRIDHVHWVHLTSPWLTSLSTSTSDLTQEPIPNSSKPPKETSPLGKLQTLSAKFTKSISAAAETSMAAATNSIKAWAHIDDLTDLPKLAKGISDFLGSGYFYYSMQTDLSRHLQSRKQPTALWNWKSINYDFIWNAFLVSGYEPHVKAFIPPVIQGHIEASTFSIPIDAESSNLSICIIARRSSLRAGLRYQRRGADEDGHVANFVELEQILKVQTPTHSHVTSYVQLRGSVPLLWYQSGFSLHPEIHLNPHTSLQTRVLVHHLASLHQRYGTIVILNLLNHQGRERSLSQRFQKEIHALRLENVSHVDFDFHREVHDQPLSHCMKLLMDQLFSGSEETYFWSHGNEKVLSQAGVIRTNCLDCLDRTNVVQTYIASHLLQVQLLRMGFENVSEDIKKWHSLAWANIGNAISQCYTGTDAMKTEYTKTGKRDLQGAANDAKKSVTRYFKNQFQDQFAQVIIDIVLGQCPWFPPDHPILPYLSALSFYPTSSPPSSQPHPSLPSFALLNALLVFGVSIDRTSSLWLIVSSQTCECILNHQSQWVEPLPHLSKVHVTSDQDDPPFALSFTITNPTSHVLFQMHCLGCFGKDSLVNDYPPFRAALALQKLIAAAQG